MMVLPRALAAFGAPAAARADVARVQESTRPSAPTTLAAGRAPIARLASLVTVAVLVALTLVLRIWGLPGKGLVAYDEGWSLSNGRFQVSFITHPGDWLRLLHEHGHLFPFGHDWKISHDLLLGGLFAAGISPENLTWYSALAGAVMVAALAALAWRRWGAAAGAVAGVFAGAVPLSIVYGHRILAEADAMAAVAVALYLWDRWWDRRPHRRLVILTILMFALTLSVNYRLLPSMMPILLVLGWLAFRYRRQDLPPRASAGRLVAVCLIPAAGIVTLYLLLIGGAALGLPRLSGYLKDEFVRSGSGSALPFALPDFYVRTFWDFLGPVVALAAGLGCVALLWSWKKLDPLAAIALGSLVGTFLFFTAIHDKAPRAIVICVPFAALVLARAVTLLNRKTLQWGAALTLCGACLISGWTSDSARLVSGSGDAGRWLAAHPGAIVASRAPVFVAYTERTWDAGAGIDPAHAIVEPDGHRPWVVDATVQGLRQRGARWVVVDSHALIISPSPVFAELIACGRPVAEFNDPAGWSQWKFLEEADSLHLGYDAILALRDRVLATSQGQTIRIYDLDGPGTAACA
jgi:hypothetical protein